MPRRKIIEIDSERCNGCGACITACAEGALALVDGKARLISDVYCDGLGACIGDCPTAAITVIEREAADFDAAPGLHPHGDHTAKPIVSAPEPTLACGCPGSHEMALKPTGRDCPEPAATDHPSELTHWPIKLSLLSPAAEYLAGADLLLLADCAAAACPNLHARLLKNRCVALGCPKFDDVESSVQRLAEIIRQARPKSVTVAHMEVPCCNGLFVIALQAAAVSGTDVGVGRVVIARTGEPLSEQAPTALNDHPHARAVV